LTSAATDLALVVLRVALGSVFLAHGWNHVWGGGRLPGTARWFESLGMRPGRVHALLASVTELGAGVLLLAGLLTPLACAGVVGVMTVAWVTNHRGNGFFIFRPGEGWEYVMVLTLVGAALSPLGAGRWSLDHLLGWAWLAGWGALAVTLVLGLGGTVALLAAAWRPGRGTG
jgi:putative oxidoreductase